MTPDDLADLHRRAFAPARGWTAQEFNALSKSPGTEVFSLAHGFALVRCIAGEAELLTLAVDPVHQRKGIADALMQLWMENCNATTAFLEVAEDNIAAKSLYAKHGFAEIGRRKAYYPRPDGRSVDALLMQASLPRRLGTETGA